MTWTRLWLRPIRSRIRRPGTRSGLVSVRPLWRLSVLRVAAAADSMNQLLPFILLGLCCGVISYTLTKGSIFGPLRVWVIERTYWLGKLMQCPYCMSHWVALGAMLV